MNQIDLTGRSAFVTGSTRGIGLAVARALYGAGASVAIVGRDAARAQIVALELGERAVGVGCDVADRGEVEAAIAAAEAAIGPIDILVNNAGLTRDNLLMRLTDEDWDAVLDANLKGAFFTIRAVIKGMMKRRAGRIINISSVVGLTGNKGQANYAASKAGLIGMTKSIAREIGKKNITANCIAPGFIQTDMTAVLSDLVKKAAMEVIPVKRFGTVEDVARAVAFFASDEAGYITGQVLCVDGGMAM